MSVRSELVLPIWSRQRAGWSRAEVTYPDESLAGSAGGRTHRRSLDEAETAGPRPIPPPPEAWSSRMRTANLQSRIRFVSLHDHRNSGCRRISC